MGLLNQEQQFNDADMAKLNETTTTPEQPEEDDMFEDLYPEDTQEGVEEEEGGGLDQPEGVEEEQEQADEGEEPDMTEEGQDFDEYGDGMSDEVKQILDSIQTSEDAQTNAQNDLSDAINS